MISSGVIAIPNHVESLKLYVGNFTCSDLNGKLAHFVSPNSQGDIVADFVKNAIPGVPRGVKGMIRLWDGNGAPMFSLKDAEMQFEVGAKDGAWTVISNFFARGLDDVSGRAIVFRANGVDPGDDRSLLVEFAVSDAASLAKQTSELGTWLG